MVSYLPVFCSTEHLSPKIRRSSCSQIVSMSVSKEECSPCVLTDYSIGDIGIDKDMTIDSKKATAAAVGAIRANDAAFVRRSDGSWTYATVENRSYGASLSIIFRVSAQGSTKEFPMSQWGTHIRPIRRRGDPPPANATSSSDTGLSAYLDNSRKDGERRRIGGGGNPRERLDRTSERHEGQTSQIRSPGPIPRRHETP